MDIKYISLLCMLKLSNGSLLRGKYKKVYLYFNKNGTDIPSRIQAFVTTSWPPCLPTLVGREGGLYCRIEYGVNDEVKWLSKGRDLTGSYFTEEKEPGHRQFHLFPRWTEHVRGNMWPHSLPLWPHTFLWEKLKRVWALSRRWRGNIFFFNRMKLQGHF